MTDDIDNYETQAPYPDDAAGDAPGGDDANEMSDVESLTQQVAEWRELAMRRAADVENLRKRAAAEKEYLASYAAEHVITTMFPVVDDLHNAVEAARQSDDAAALKEGLRMIYQKAVKIMGEAGVKVIVGGVGEPFNVDMHEALMHMPSELPEGHVVQMVQMGYTLHDKVLRHAKVITSAGMLEAGGRDEEKA
jgi:molecular chaperone GrpE